MAVRTFFSRTLAVTGPTGSLDGAGPRLFEASLGVVAPLLKATLGSGAQLVEFGLLAAMPGAHEQPRHSDNNQWVFAPGNPSESSALCLTVFVSLVDVGPNLGGLDVWLGTHTAHLKVSGRK